MKSSMIDDVYSLPVLAIIWLSDTQQKLEKKMNERFPPPAAGTVVRKPVPPGRPVSDTEVDKEPKKRG